MNIKPPKNWVLIAAAVSAIILLAGSRELISFLVDWQFFREVGFESVFKKTFTAKLLIGFVFGLAAFLMVLTSPSPESARPARHDEPPLGKRAAIAAPRPEPADDRDLSSGGVSRVRVRLPDRRAVLGACAPVPEQHARGTR
jgi:hypothetical protein